MRIKIRMKIHHVLLFCFSSAFMDGNTGLVDAQSNIYTGTEGKDFSIQLPFKARRGSRKYLCRNDCEREDILVETRGTRANKGRYVIRYDNNVVHVIIKALTQSDVGRYRVGSSSRRSYKEFEIKLRAGLCDGGFVSGEPRVYSMTEGGNITVTCSLFSHPQNRKFLCREDCNSLLVDTDGSIAMSDRYKLRHVNSSVFNVTITQLTKSDSGRYRCGAGRQYAECQEFDITVTGAGLCDGGFVSGEPRVYSATEGGNITVTCSLFSHPQNRKFLCREDCNSLLVNTSDFIAMSDRYKIRYVSRSVFNVTITQLTKSDSGRYRCGAGRQYAQCQEFDITVTGGNFLHAFVCLTVVVVPLAVCLLLLYKWKTRSLHCVNSSGKGRDTEISMCDDCAAVSSCEGSIYQDLAPRSRDQNLYSTLRT